MMTATKPSQIISVDQLVSATPRLMAQLKGNSTTECYACATIFVDQCSSMSFAFLQKGTGAECTVEAKKAFKTHGKTFGVAPLHHHCNNGIFSDSAWWCNCTIKNQRLTFCGVNPHFQNGIAERHIRVLQDMAQMMLAHSKTGFCPLCLQICGLVP